MKTYILTIKYNEDTEEMEYLSEEIVEEEDAFYYGDVELSEYFDDETVELLKDTYIIGESWFS